MPVGLTVRIEVSKQLMNQTSGLCGRFNGLSNDDKTGRDGIGLDSLTKLAKSWLEDNQECQVSETAHAAACEEVSVITFIIS